MHDRPYHLTDNIKTYRKILMDMAHGRNGIDRMEFNAIRINLILIYGLYEVIQLEDEVGYKYISENHIQDRYLTIDELEYVEYKLYRGYD